MLNAEQLKHKINSTQEFQTIVKTMKSLAAVNIHQYEHAVLALQHYHQTLRMGMQVLLMNYPEFLQEFKFASHHRRGIVVIGTDQGMCGRFNEQLAHVVALEIQTGDPPKLLTIGSRMYDTLTQYGYDIEHHVGVPASLEGITLKVQEIVSLIDQWRQEKQVDTILLFHNRPIQGASYRVRRRQLFPFDLHYIQRVQQLPWRSRSRPQVFCDRDLMFSALFRQYFFVTLYRGCAESLASENMSRLAAMQVAQKNIEERLVELQSLFQQQRQAVITQELLDIMSGFEALQTHLDP